MTNHHTSDALQPTVWNPEDYALLDFGRGRKLERFGGRLIDRVCPAAAHVERAVNCDWSQADLRLDERGRLTAGTLPSEDWQCRFGSVVFHLKLTPFGHLGLFPEQAPNWDWLAATSQCLAAAQQCATRALNLFAYTGGSTLALAAAGAQVVHLDASAPAVKWAQRNALTSHLEHRPIRWIVDDARAFVRRELKRGNRYQLIVLDPPSYGHGHKGQAWNIVDDLQALLSDCIQLLSLPNAALLLTAHSESPGPDAIAKWIANQARMHCVHARMALTTSAGKALDAGYHVRATTIDRAC